MTPTQSNCLSCSSLGFDSWQGRNSEFLLGNGIRRDGGAEPQLLVSTPNIPGLNPKSFHSEHVVKIYVLTIVIHPLDGNVRPGSPLGAFQ